MFLGGGTVTVKFIMCLYHIRLTSQSAYLNYPVKMPKEKLSFAPVHFFYIYFVIFLTIYVHHSSRALAT
jgi:hypothetical protein